MVGQGHVVQALTMRRPSSELHHAYLFTAPRASADDSLRILAGAQLRRPGRQQRRHRHALQHVPPCLDVGAAVSSITRNSSAASNHEHDKVQSLLEQAGYRRVQGRFKVFMIDEVRMLSGHAFNAMLKTLEDRPRYLELRPRHDRSARRCRSQCCRAACSSTCGRCDRDHSGHLAHVSKTRPNVPATRLRCSLLARAAHSSMRDALSLPTRPIAYGAGKLGGSPVRQMLGGLDGDHVFRLIERWRRATARPSSRYSEDLAAHG